MIYYLFDNYGFMIFWFDQNLNEYSLCGYKNE